VVRVPEITNREDLPEDQREFYDSIITSRKQIGAPYNFLLHAPDLAARTAHLIGYSLFSTDFPKDVKELAICTVARELNCAFEWAAHADHAIKAGIREECIKIIQDRKAPTGLTERESEVVRYVQELLRPPHRIRRRDVRSAKGSHGCCSTSRIDWNHRRIRGACVLAQRFRGGKAARTTGSAALVDFRGTFSDVVFAITVSPRTGNISDPSEMFCCFDENKNPRS